MAQEESGREEIIEEILGLIDSAEELEIVHERLDRLSAHPIDLNQADAEELATLPFLDDFAIRNILLYRSQHSGFRSIYDLKNVQGIPFDRLPLLEPFITAGDSPYSFGTHRTRQRMVIGGSVPFEKEAFRPGMFLRYEGDADKFAWHLSLERDRDEPWLPLRKGGFDFAGAAVSWESGEHQAVLGDYRITTGQGLLMGQSLSYFSSIEYGGASVTGRTTLKAHRSFREIGFLRGLAGRTKLGAFGLTAFFGFEPIDARIEEGRIRTLYGTGLHRTAGERRYRHTARREVAGTYISYDPDERLHAGVTGVAYRYRRSTDGMTLLPPVGQNAKQLTLLASVDVRYLARDWQVFAESTMPAGKDAWAVQGGAEYSSDRLGKFTLQGRYLGRMNFAPYGRPDSYSSTGRDERGLRVIWQGELARWTTGTLYFDRFSKLLPGSKASNVLTARIEYAEGENRLVLYGRYIRREEEPERFTLTLQGKRRFGRYLTLQAEPRISKTAGERLSYAVSARIRYQKEPFTSDFSLQYFDLKGNAVMRGYAPYMPLMYGSQMLRHGGWFATGRVSYAVSESLGLNLRLSHLYYTKGGLSPVSLMDLSMTVKF